MDPLTKRVEVVEMPAENEVSSNELPCSRTPSPAPAPDATASPVGEKQTQEEPGTPGASDDEPEEPEKKLTRSKIVLIMSALCIATFLAALDMTIITTALPTITREFNASQADYTWIGSAYLLAAASATPTWGKVSDIFGRKPILLMANVIFLIGSLLCGVSVNVRMLIGSRVVQGIGGGGLLILVNICISDLFSMRSRSMYFGIVGMVWAVAGVVGPLIGGLMTQLITWRWCFYINLPIDGIAFIIIFFFLEVHTPKTPIIAGLRAIDWLGSVTIIGGTVMLLLGLEYGGVSFPWSSATVICLLIFGVVSLALFVIIQWKVSYFPIMPLWLFSKRSTIAACGTGFAHGMLYTSGSYFLPFYFQAVLGATPLQSGIYLFPTVISISITSALTGVFIRKTGLYLPPIWSGMALILLGHGLYTDLPVTASWPRIIIYQAIAGTGLGPNFQAPLLALQSHLKPNDVATATSTLSFCRNLANSVSVVLGGVVFQNQMQANLGSLSSVLSPETMKVVAGTSAGASTEIVQALPDHERIPVLEAYTRSLKVMWIFYTVVAAVGLLVSLLIQRQKLDKEHEVTKTGLDVQERERRERIQRGKEEKGKKGGSKVGDVEKS